MPKQSVLVAGGAGYIGSHVVKMLDRQGFHPVTFDNLSLGCREAVTCGSFVQGDLGHNADLEKLFQKHRFAAVLHFAAFIDVGESVLNPAKYYLNNVAYTLNLLETMRRHQVNHFIFSSTAAIYGIPHQPRLSETHPCAPINPYGETKLIVEKILRDYDAAYGLKSIALRYFNAAGGDPDGVIKNFKTRDSNLIPIVLRSLKNPTSCVTIFGTDYPTPDGTCIRDYIHIEDLGAAHVLALEQLLQGKDSAQYNLGNGNGFSVREVIHAAEKVTGLKVNVIEGGRRAGDPPILIADSTKAKQQLGWKPHYFELETMLAHAWKALN